jgi:hypothetical protein
MDKERLNMFGNIAKEVIKTYREKIKQNLEDMVSSNNQEKANEEHEENGWNRWNDKYKNFKIDKTKLGNYIVEKWPIHEPTYFMGMKIGSSVSSNAPEAYGVFRIDPYNIEIHPEQTYKVHLTPVGKLKDFMPDRAWYCCDIKSSLDHFHAEYFEDPFEAQDYANKKNAELFPEYSEFFGVPKNLTNMQKIVKAVFKL